MTLLQNPHARAAGAFAAIALAIASLRGPAPGNDIAALAVAIGAPPRVAWSPADVRWEPSGGVLSDLVLGRFALVLAATTPGGPRDV